MKPHATVEGTHRYADRFAGRTGGAHFVSIPDPDARHIVPTNVNAEPDAGLAVSTIGIGTYLGEPDQATDAAYTEAVITAVESGFNVVDTAINYRLQRSERSIGAALAELARRGYTREEILLCTKAGYLTPDGEHARQSRSIFPH